MPSDRLLHILDELRSRTSQPDPDHLCEVSADVIGVTGAGIVIMPDRASRTSICSSNAVSALIEELQFTLGEGPGIDAFDQSQPVLEPDLAAPAVSRWTVFAPPALDAGVRAIFGFPMLVGTIPFGTLNLYRDSAGTLSEDQYADALVMAQVGTRAVLSMQFSMEAESSPFDRAVGSQLRYVVHQASGMVAAQLHIPVGEALDRLKAKAFADDQVLIDLSKDVVARRVRFDREDGVLN